MIPEDFLALLRQQKVITEEVRLRRLEHTIDEYYFGGGAMSKPEYIDTGNDYLDRLEANMTNVYLDLIALTHEVDNEGVKKGLDCLGGPMLTVLAGIPLARVGFTIADELVDWDAPE